MSEQAKFDIEAQKILAKNQWAMDFKLFLSHWSGYSEIRERHEKELKALAQTYGVELDMKKWKLIG